MTEGVKLTKKQRVFVDEYLVCFNASQAAKNAGYKAKNARQTGHENLTKPYIKSEIECRLAEIHMSSEEALKLLADMARGDIGQVMDITSIGFNLNMKRAQDLGLTKIIKKVKQKTTTYIAKKESEEDREVTELEIELYDAQAAIDKVLRVHGSYKNNIDITSGGRPLTWKEFIADDNPESSG